MSDLFSALRSAGSALQAFQTALDVTQNNVGNSQTPGYVHQTAILDPLGFNPPAGLEGGVTSDRIQSSRNEFAETAVRNAQSLYGGSSQLASSLNPIESAFNITGTGGVSNALDALFQSFSAWSVSPADVNAQSSVLNAAASVSSAFQQTAAQLSSARSGTD